MGVRSRKLKYLDVYKFKKECGFESKRKRAMKMMIWTEIHFSCLAMLYLKLKIFPYNNKTVVGSEFVCKQRFTVY